MLKILKCLKNVKNVLKIKAIKNVNLECCIMFGLVCSCSRYTVPKQKQYPWDFLHVYLWIIFRDKIAFENYASVVVSRSWRKHFPSQSVCRVYEEMFSGVRVLWRRRRIVVLMPSNRCNTRCFSDVNFVTRTSTFVNNTRYVFDSVFQGK